MIEAPAQDAPGPERWRPFSGLPVLTMAINITLIAVVFLTRGRWEPWVVGRELHGLVNTRSHIGTTPGGDRVLLHGDGRILLIDEVTGRTLFEHPFFTHEGWTKAVMSPDGRRFAIIRKYLSGSEDDPLIVDAETGSEVSFLRGHSGGIEAAAFSPDGSRIATAGKDQTARVWDVSTGRQLVTLKGTGKYVFVIAWSPDGERIVTNHGEISAGVWDARTGERLLTLEGHTDIVRRAEFCAGGDRVITTDEWEPANCILWDARDGEPVALFAGFSSFVCSPDGMRIATTRFLGVNVRLWDARTGASLAKIRASSEPSGELAVTFSPDGKTIMTRNPEFGARVSDTRTGKQLFVTPYVDPVRATFTPDGTRIVDCHPYGTFGDGRPLLVIIDSRTGEFLVGLREVGRFAVLGDDRILAWVGHDPTPLYRRIRPEWWWGAFWLWHFWVIAALVVALAASIRRDVRIMRREREARAG
ncbi:MAG: WD40 repeat domain-containing protein [Planctomycetota bacterium]|jgi:dipeptidyl aminopeptidase/acylaminoacyl peptidase